MCGRFTLHLSKKELAEALALEIPDSFEPDYNIAPGQEILAVRRLPERGAETAPMLWGLKTPQNFHVNARIETADTTPRFREAWESSRCLIPANGFYEWYRDGISKQPYYLYASDTPLIYMAGLFFPPAFDGATASCVVLTTEAHPDMAGVHHRMPTILPHAAHHEWLVGELRKRDAIELAAAFAPTKHPVSYRVNSAQNKESRLIEATAPDSDDQLRLF